MIGYVRAFKPELLVGEYELYKGVYCSLCRSLMRNYSPLAQIFLNYDYTLAALVLLAVRGDKCVFERGRCPYNPLKKCLSCSSREVFDLCSHAVIITVYNKLRDNIRDKGFFSRLLALILMPAVYLMYRKARRKAPEVDRIVCEAMKKQNEAETRACALDEAAHPSAEALGKILSLGAVDEQHKLLYTLGYMIGRFVYILDAADDLPDDIKRGNFNPFTERASELKSDEGRAKFAQSVMQMLNFTQSEAVKALGELDIKRFDGILENIIYDGLTASAKAALAKYTGEEMKQTKLEIS